MDFELVVFYVTSPFSTNCFSSAFHSIFTGKRIKTNPISLDFPRDFRLVFIITYGHSYATNLYRAGIDLKTAQYLLGHSSIEMTANVYTHLAKEETAASVIQLERYLSGGSQTGGDFLKSSQRGKLGGSRKKKKAEKPHSF
nr:tyrosine-type recombinase/integrase [Acutalibacter muris]